MWVTAEPSSVNVKPLFFGLLFISALLLPLVPVAAEGWGGGGGFEPGVLAIFTPGVVHGGGKTGAQQMT